jgi:hypothetical protein
MPTPTDDTIRDFFEVIEMELLITDQMPRYTQLASPTFVTTILTVTTILFHAGLTFSKINQNEHSCYAEGQHYATQQQQFSSIKRGIVAMKKTRI